MYNVCNIGCEVTDERRKRQVSDCACRYGTGTLAVESMIAVGMLEYH